MGLLTDLWSVVPKEVKIIFGIAVFMYMGAAILNVLIFLWNVLFVGGTNLINGCVTGAAEVCVPSLNGIFIFGINFADYWTVTFLIFFPAMILFAFKWYSAMGLDK